MSETPASAFLIDIDGVVLKDAFALRELLERGV